MAQNGDTDVFAFLGQSLNMINPNGTPVSGQAPTFPDGQAVYWTGSGLSSLSGIDGPGAAFCKTWHDATGRLAVMVPCAVGSTPLLKVSDIGHGWWTPDGTLLSAAIAKVHACLDWLVGNEHRPYTNDRGNRSASATLWAGLETDARQFNNGVAGISLSTLIEGLQSVVSTIQRDGRFAGGFYISRTGMGATNSGGDLDAGFALARAVQEAIAWPNSNSVFIMNHEKVNYPAIGLQPTASNHPSQLGFNDDGIRMATGVRQLFASMGL
jgi:hypothetical protein